MRPRLGLLLCAAVLGATPRPGGAQGDDAAPRDSVAIALRFLARERQGQARAVSSGQALAPDSVVQLTVRLGGRAGRLIRDSLARQPLRMIGDTAPLRTLSVDSLVFTGRMAVLFVTSTGASAEPGPWWENVDRWVFRWDATARDWWLDRIVLTRASDGFWSAPAAGRRASPGT